MRLLFLTIRITQVPEAKTIRSRPTITRLGYIDQLCEETAGIHTEAPSYCRIVFRLCDIRDLWYRNKNLKPFTLQRQLGGAGV